MTASSKAEWRRFALKNGTCSIIPSTVKGDRTPIRSDRDDMPRDTFVPVYTSLFIQVGYSVQVGLHYTHHELGLVRDKDRRNERESQASFQSHTSPTMISQFDNFCTRALNAYLHETES